jgi:hypothetical protein
LVHEEVTLLIKKYIQKIDVKNLHQNFSAGTKPARKTGIND